MLTDAQKIRAARAILGWTQWELARASTVGLNTIVRIEQGLGNPHANNLAAIFKSFDDQGIRFTECSITRDERHAVTASDGKNKEAAGAEDQ